PKRGLGRGLGALLGNAPIPVSPSVETLAEIPVDRITPNPYQPRKHFDAAALDELKSSIAEFGVLVPIIVRRRGDGYELIAGERRWRACAALQKATISAIVRGSDDRQTLEVAIIENLQRENLNPLEEAAGFQNLVDEFAFTQEQLAQRLGKSRPAIANTLRLLGLPDAIKAMLADGRLSGRHGRALLAAPEAVRLQLAQRAAIEGLTVRALEELAAAASAPPSAKTTGAKPRTLSADELDFESRLRERFGTHVALVRGGRGGRIELRFENDDELLRLSDLLLGTDA
ncbi:MAG: ParB/RepB/Spo0J family partition protein, partial [Candidatus Eremiobacteraeota bacterium]|nr:ParB/RepB/Spo0J family partition protein [Candidatus Eremiobacteraeota bacterium]